MIVLTRIIVTLNEIESIVGTELHLKRHNALCGIHHNLLWLFVAAKVATPNAILTALVLDDQYHLGPTLGRLLEQEHFGLSKESMGAWQFDFARDQLNVILTCRWPAVTLLISVLAPRVSPVVHESDCMFVLMPR